jgi:hypothetical protein
VSEAELQKNKEMHGASLEDDKPAHRSLTEAIMAQREEKEAKFQEAWKVMKQGMVAVPAILQITMELLTREQGLSHRLFRGHTVLCFLLLLLLLLL